MISPPSRRPGLRLPGLIALGAVLGLAGPVHAQTDPGARPPVMAATPAADVARLRSIVDRAALEAELIVSGEVREARAVSVDAGRRIMTLVSLRVLQQHGPGETGAHRTGAEEVEVVLPGGALGELAQRVGGVPAVEAGEGLLLFLRPRPGPARETPRFELTALGLSLWRLDGDEAVLAPEAVRLVTREGERGREPLRLKLGELPALLEARERGP